jgi:hypothetical protein
VLSWNDGKVSAGGADTKEVSDELWHMEKAWTGLEFDRDRAITGLK